MYCQVKERIGTCTISQSAFWDMIGLNNVWLYVSDRGLIRAVGFMREIDVLYFKNVYVSLSTFNLKLGS